MSKHDREMMKAIASMAAEEIDRQTQSKTNHWAEALRRFDPGSLTAPNVDLHALLRSASESFGKRRLSGLSKTLLDYMMRVDQLRPMSSRDDDQQ